MNHAQRARWIVAQHGIRSVPVALGQRIALGLLTPRYAAHQQRTVRMSWWAQIRTAQTTQRIFIMFHPQETTFVAQAT